MKKNKLSLKQLFLEDITKTIDAQGPQEEVPDTELSLDQKIDHFLVQYERESVPMSQQFTQESLFRKLNKFLFEADENKPEDMPTDDENPLGGDTDPSADLGGMSSGGLGGGLGGADSGMEDNSSNQSSSSTTSEPVAIPKINISNFAKNIAQLANNYQTLINPQRIILNRAKAYIEKNYNTAIANEMMEILDVEFNLSEKDYDERQRETNSPIAAGALEPLG